MKEIFETPVLEVPNATVNVPYTTEIKISEDPDRIALKVTPSNIESEDFNYTFDDDSITISFTPKEAGIMSVDVMVYEEKLSYGSNFYITILPEENEVEEAKEDE